MKNFLVRLTDDSVAIVKGTDMSVQNGVLYVFNDKIIVGVFIAYQYALIEDGVGI